MTIAYSRFLVSETHATVETPTLMGSSAVSPAPGSLTQDDLKKIAAYKAVEHVKSGMVVGLGTGSTAKHAVDRIADLLHQGILKDIVGIPTSTKTYDQAVSLGIPLSDLDAHPVVDLAIDGADEVDPALNLVKGRGGSLLREKMVESVSKKFVVIVDESKLVNYVGGSGLAMPVEVIPFCWNHSLRRLVDLFAYAGCVGELRKIAESGKPSVTDNGNFVIDLYFGRDIGDLSEASDAILRLPGIVEHGMFIGLATSLIVAGVDGITVKTKVGSEVEVNSNLCSKFSVDHYPMLLWGSPSKFVSGSWGPEKDKSEIHYVDDGQTADRLLNWINKQMNSSYSLDDENYENEHLQRNVSDPGQISRAIYDIEEATSTALDIILKHKMIKSESQTSLIKFFQLLVVHHPSRRCRRGSAQILVDFDEFAAKTKEAASGQEKGVLGNYQICGKDVPRGYWIFCRGSKNETRGFSCGLWVLLHSLSVRVNDGESHAAFGAICDFIENFFICQECRQHFHDMCSSVTNPFKKARDFTLWLWDAHNKVNERLMKEEAKQDTGDPEFPKTIWPPRQLCPSCYHTKSIKDDDKDMDVWDRDEVYMFLVDYYGKRLLTLYKDKELLSDKTNILPADDITASAHAVVVPVGAALAIAVASCAFGALACYWRQQQKSRKPKRSWK